jgi:hypothetical protein
MTIGGHDGCVKNDIFQLTYTKERDRLFQLVGPVLSVKYYRGEDSQTACDRDPIGTGDPPHPGG